MITKHQRELASRVLDESNDHDARALADRLADARELAESVLAASIDEHADCDTPCGLEGCEDEEPTYHCAEGDEDDETACGEPHDDVELALVVADVTCAECLRALYPGKH
jgi:hypothetical protein